MTFHDIRSEIEQKEIEAWYKLIRILTHEVMNSITPLSSLTETIVMLLENKDGEFIQHQLPNLSQVSSINQILVKDFNNDKNLDILIAGNLYWSEVETPRNDAGVGLYLEGNGKGSFKAITPSESGLYIPGDTKDLSFINIKEKTYILAAKNDDEVQFIEVIGGP